MGRGSSVVAHRHTRMPTDPCPHFHIVYETLDALGWRESQTFTDGSAIDASLILELSLHPVEATGLAAWAPNTGTNRRRVPRDETGPTNRGSGCPGCPETSHGGGKRTRIEPRHLGTSGSAPWTSPVAYVRALASVHGHQVQSTALPTESFRVSIPETMPSRFIVDPYPPADKPGRVHLEDRHATLVTHGHRQPIWDEPRRPKGIPGVPARLDTKSL